jgi:hypothetical protein
MQRAQDPRETTLPAVPGPRFCSGCGKSAPEIPGNTACPSCGDRLIPQGYCPVCERYLRQPVGTACPKHDLPLEASAPQRARFGGAGGSVQWATVGRYSDSLAAEAPRIRLEAEGIPTFVEGERMGARSMYHVATGGVKLKVPDDMATDARIILSQTWSATAAALDFDETADDDLDGDDSVNEPKPLSLRDLVLNEIIIGSIVIVPLFGLLYAIYRFLSPR